MLNPLIATLLYVFDTLVSLYIFVIVLAVVMSWLIAFGVVNLHNQFVRSLVSMLDALTDPVFRQVRRIIPAIGGLDLSPLIVLIALQALRMLVDGYAFMLG
jgi:YggT family protein